MTPVRADILENRLKLAGYDEKETKFLIQGFSKGFDIGYCGPRTRQSLSRNIPLRVRNHIELWNKIIKEVKTGRVAGPFEKIPFSNYIQSPIRLVPKAGNSGKTRLIFHLSYDFGDQEHDFSLNYHTREELCTVKYEDLDTAVKICIEVKQEGLKKSGKTSTKTGGVMFDECEEPTAKQSSSPIFMSKTDVQSAFCLAPLARGCWPWLIMMAFHPIMKKKNYFVDKCLLFGASISCAIFQ